LLLASAKDKNRPLKDSAKAQQAGAEIQSGLNRHGKAAGRHPAGPLATVRALRADPVPRAGQIAPKALS
jgi:hypothetical protein